MKFIPAYRVSYNGNFYEAGKPFEIDSKDAAEMAKHGKVVEDFVPPAVKPAEPRRPGRPRKIADG